MITGLSHITFLVKDLEESSRFWEAIFDAQPVYASGQKQFSLSEERFFLIGGVWVCLMRGDPLPERTYNHIAFQVPEDALDIYLERVKAFGAEIRPGRSRVQGEGRSVYFYDLDNHLFELHSGTLSERLQRYSL